MFALLTDPVVIFVLVALGVMFTVAALYMENQDRLRLGKPPLTIKQLATAVGSAVINFLNEWAPVFRTRTGAHATLLKALSLVGITVAAPRLELWVTILLLAANVYCWLRALHGRKNVTRLFAPLPPADIGPRPGDSDPFTDDRAAQMLGFKSAAEAEADYLRFRDARVEPQVGGPAAWDERVSPQNTPTASAGQKAGDDDVRRRAKSKKSTARRPTGKRKSAARSRRLVRRPATRKASRKRAKAAPKRRRA